MLEASTEVDGSIIELLFANPAEDDILVDCAAELLFDTCGRYDDVIDELENNELEVAFMEE